MKRSPWNASKGYGIDIRTGGQQLLPGFHQGFVATAGLAGLEHRVQNVQNGLLQLKMCNLSPFWIIDLLKSQHIAHSTPQPLQHDPAKPPNVVALRVACLSCLGPKVPSMLTEHQYYSRNKSMANATAVCGLMSHCLGHTCLTPDCLLLRQCHYPMQSLIERNTHKKPWF